MVIGIKTNEKKLKIYVSFFSPKTRQRQGCKYAIVGLRCYRTFWPKCVLTHLSCFLSATLRTKMTLDFYAFFEGPSDFLKF